MIKIHPSRPGRVVEVLWLAFWLGCTSFGGPIAHLGYFERAYVEQRLWLTREQYAALVAYCSMLPGPTSSQVGFLVGLHRAGWCGALVAWIGFTFPSACLMYLAAMVPASIQIPGAAAALHGLMLTAVAVVGHAVWSMSRTLAADAPRRLIAAAAGAILLVHEGGFTQVAVLLGAAITGLAVCKGATHSTPPLQSTPSAIGTRTGLVTLILLHLCLPLLAAWQQRSPLALANIFYRSGSLVFGGGHVVLPLLQSSLVHDGWVSNQQFLAGYGLAQAMPGPLFTVSAYLGASAAPPSESLVFAATALSAIFLPGLLLCVAVLRAWKHLSGQRTGAALAGINAAVVGLLAAAFYDPVWLSAVHSVTDVLAALASFLLLTRRTSPGWIALLCLSTSYLAALFL